jgi:hypothetical protein
MGTSRTCWLEPDHHSPLPEKAWSEVSKNIGDGEGHARNSAKFRRGTRRANCCVALVSNDDHPTADELPYGGPTTIDTGPLVAFIKEIARLNRRAASWTAFAALLEGLATIAHYYGR